MGWPYHNKPPMGWPLDWDNHINDGLVGYWYMPEGSGNTIQDLSGKGNHGAILSDTIWDSGKYDSALLFDGSGGGVNCGNNSSLDITGDMTIVFSFNPDDVSSTIHRILHKNTAYSLWTQSLAQANRLKLHNYTDASTADSLASLTANEWQHIAVVKKGTVVNFYRNAIDISDDTTITAAFPTSVVDLYIGIDEDETSLPYDGHLDYMYLYNRALTLNEIALFYREPFCGFMNPDEIPVLDQYYTVGANPKGPLSHPLCGALAGPI